MRLLTAKEMAQIDAETINTLGVPGVVLMENAARGVTEVIYREVKGTSAVVVCGKGNNGGDGLAVARNLYNLGYDVEVILTAPVEELKGDARVNGEILSRLPVPIHVVREESQLLEVYSLLKEADFVVDALFGTGLSKPLSGFYAELVDVVNRAAKEVVSVDIPSGISADTGQIIGPHVKADYTVTFAFPKIAHVMPPACDYVGKLFIVDISIPEDIPFFLGPERYLLTLDEVAFTYPLREVMDHKYTFGHLLVVGGSKGKTGAPSMAADAALRAGVGLSTVMVPESLNGVFEVKLTEVMSLPVDDGGRGIFAVESLDEALKLVRNGKFSAVVVGPGLGSDPSTFEFAREFIKECNLPMVIDADGLNALAEDTSPLKLKETPVVITPHVGEFVRLSGVPKEEVLKEPWRHALEFARSHRVVVVLKSGRTVVATPEGQVFVNVIGNPGMATAGTGDVLAGVIGALLAMGIDAEDAAKFGVFLHSLAGDIAAKRLTQEGMKATDLITFLPEAIKRIKELEVEPLRGELPFVTSLREAVGV
ncbi:NAD(P)H-hydrate dehydratase [Thermovibrio ammonificans]